MPSQRKRVTFEEEADLKAVLYAECGIYASVASKNIGLSRGQVYYRARKAGVKFSDFRNGKNQVSRMLIKQLSTRTHMGKLKQKIMDKLASGK